MNQKIYNDVVSGKADNNIMYGDLQNLIVDLGFEFRRQDGSHTMYYNKILNEFINIQRDGAKAKGYQVKQVRTIIKKHGL